MNFVITPTINILGNSLFFRIKKISNDKFLTRHLIPVTLLMNIQ